jgi:hypothetical protein
MRIVFSGLCAIALLCTLVACGDRAAASPTESRGHQIDGTKVPVWVADPSYDDQFGAVGISRPSLGGMNETFKKARMEGRLELARIISTKVQAAYVRYFQEGGEIYAGEKGPEYQTMATEMAEDTSRQITDQLLQGTKQMEFWQHPESKDMYVWMIIDPEAMDMIADQVKVAARSSARRSNIAAELKTKEALERLDAAIDAEMERQSGM